MRFKPEAEPVVRGAEALCVPAGECFYVGDSPYDIQAGKAAGCSTIAVTWGMFDEETLEGERPDCMCGSPRELSKILIDAIFA